VIPSQLTGKEFEKLVVEQAAIYEEKGIACIGRYGVQANMAPKKIPDGGRQFETVMIQSLPDFEGIRMGGSHITFDAKVCSAASFAWAKYRSETRGARSRQLRHMLKRSRFGADCYFLIHWNERVLKAKTIPAATYAFPVDYRMEYWDKVESMEVKSLTQEDCQSLGRLVEWNKTDRGTKFRPLFLG
jgi:penicillin-binding protein-related factor A (putative recombinase)